jgi:uncharacterized protein YceH (UPF0502 family)
VQVSPVAARILGCLVEKSHTTPDQYPLSLNALVTACNQSTNRWPVVRYDESTVEAGLDELRALELVRREKPHGGRAIKYSETVRRIVPMGDAELAVLAVLLLRGPQTPGELKSRTERLHAFTDLDDVLVALEALAGHEDGAVAVQLPREPGRKEARWADRLQVHDDGVPGPAAADEEPGAAGVASVTRDELLARIEALESAVVGLTRRVDGLSREGEH